MAEYPFVTASVRVTRESWKALKQEGLDSETSVQELVQEAIDSLLAKRAKRKA